MNIQKEELGNSQVQLTVELEAKQIEQARKQAARKLAREVKIPGFRPGKAPYEMVVRVVGEANILEEAVQVLFPTALEQAVTESGIQVYSYEDIEADIDKIDPLTFRFTIPTMPVVRLGDVDNITVERQEVEVSEERVEEMLAELRQSRASWVPTLGPAAYGDRATLDLRMDLMDGTTVSDEKGLEIVIEERKAQEGDEGESEETDAEPEAPDLGANLVGAMVNQVKEFPLVYPATWPDQRLAGRTVLYRAALLDLKRQQEAALDDEFAQSVGDFETLDALRERIRSNLVSQAEDEEFNRVVEAILDGLVEESELEYPQAMVKHEIGRQVAQLERQLSSYGMDLPKYLEMTGKSQEELEDDFRDEAESFVERSLAISTYIEQSELAVSDDEVERELDDLLRPYGPNASAVRERLRGEGNMLGDIVNRLLSRKAIYHLYSTVTGEDAPPLFPMAQGTATGDEAEEGRPEPSAETSDEPEIGEATESDAAGDEPEIGEVAESDEARERPDIAPEVAAETEATNEVKEA